MIHGADSPDYNLGLAHGRNLHAVEILRALGFSDTGQAMRRGDAIAWTKREVETRKAAEAATDRIKVDMQSVGEAVGSPSTMPATILATARSLRAEVAALKRELVDLRNRDASKPRNTIRAELVTARAELAQWHAASPNKEPAEWFVVRLAPDDGASPSWAYATSMTSRVVEPVVYQWSRCWRQEDAERFDTFAEANALRLKHWPGGTVEHVHGLRTKRIER